MADDDDEVSQVTASPPSPTQSHRTDDGGIGTEVVEEELSVNPEQAAAVVDGVDNEGIEIGGGNGVVGSDEVKIGEDKSEVVKREGDFRLESVAAIEGCAANDVVEEKGELEKNGESSESVKGEVLVEKKGEEFDHNMDVCADVEKINESSKNVQGDGGEENLGANSDLVGMVIEDCHTKVVHEKGEEFGKNLALEQCAVMTLCDNMEQIDHSSGKVRDEDGEERAAGSSSLIGKGIEDCHMNDAVEEKVGEEKNISAEESVAVPAIGDKVQIDEARNTLQKEELVEDNVAVNTDLISVGTEDSHINGAIVEERSEEFEKNISLEQGAAVTTIGNTDQIADSMNKSDEDGVREENVVGDSEKIGVEVTKDHIEESGNGGNEAHGGDEDEEMVSGEENTNNKEKLEEDISAVPDVQVVLEPITGDGDEDMGSEEENTGKETLGESLSAAPDVEFSHPNVVLEPTTDDGDGEMGLEVESKDTKKKLQEDLSAAPDVDFSLHNVVLETAAGVGDEVMGLVEHKENTEKLEENLSSAPDVEFSLHNAVPETAAGDGDEEMGSEEENSEDKDKLEKDLSAAPGVEFSLRNVELEPTTGEEDEEFVDGEEPSTADAVEAKIETPDSEKSNIKPKRGRKPSKAAITKKTEEDLCFICFDGGDLVVCDRRGCPKVYHPSCVNRDEAFFKAKGRWNCGWHLCSKCEKNAQYMCLTCTFSLCKGCIKDTDFYSVRGNKGFCETCFKTVKLIESREQGNNNEENSNFDDKTCWESLFKDYWMDMKERLQLTSEELTQAKNLWKGSDAITTKQKPADETYNMNDNADSGLNHSSSNVIAVTPKRKKNKRLSKSVAKGEDSPSGSDSSGNGNKSKKRKTKKQLTLSRKRGSSGNEGGVDTGSKWASNELLKFVMHMRNGDASVLSQFEVQELLLEYIKTNKLRDPRRKSQIICDPMLKGLFGKQRVGHFEMLKLLENHFLMNMDINVDEFHGSSVDNGASPSDGLAKAEAAAKTNKDKKRKLRRKGFGRGTQSNTADYAAIDIHNISLVFLRRNLMEILLEDVDNFQDKVVGAFVRIRITGSNQIQDMYRLVQIVGTTKAPMPYKVGKHTTEFNLEIQNLNKQEVVSIDIISNQEFTEDECSRLRQSIKCGLIPRLTVGDILEKAMDLQAARVNDWLETEMVRLSHLCDRASDMGKRKELRENVEKLQNLKKPEERQRRLKEIPEVHSDPKMDPSYESDEEEEADDRKQETFMRPRGSSLARVGKDALSPRKGGSAVTDSWSGTKGHSDSSRELGRSLSSKGDDISLTGEFTRVHGRSDQNELLHGRDKLVPYSSQLGGGNTHTTVASESVSGSVSDSHQTIASLSHQTTTTTTTVNESEKIWHYKDPSGKVQGPFSIVQLRKWNSTGFFPKDLAIWKINEDQDDGILLLDALAGKFHKEIKLNGNLSNKSNIVQSGLSSLPHSGRNVANGSMANSASQISPAGLTRLSVDVSMNSGGTMSSGYDSRNEYTNLPSPTPNQILASTGGEASVNRLSSGARTVTGSLSAGGSHLYGSPTNSSATNPYQKTYSQQTSSSGYQSQQPNPSAISVNEGAGSRNSVSASPNMIRSVAHQVQPSGQNAPNNQISLPASSAYTQWSNPAAASTDKPGGSFPNQGFLGNPALTNQQPGMQPMVVPDQSWRPVSGNPNMGWGVVQANTSWTPTGQVTQQINPNWAVQGMVPVIGNAASSWMPSANSMPYGAQMNNQIGGIMNPSWAGPTSINTSTNQPWAAAGQGSLQNTATHSNNVSNQASWAANRQNVNDRYLNNQQQGGDGGYNQRGGGSQPRVCEYYLSNRCRKGSACKWVHPQRQ